MQGMRRNERRSIRKYVTKRVTIITPQKGKRSSFGAIAQLGEHLLCKQGVVGSIPTGSTIITVINHVEEAISKSLVIKFLLLAF